MNLLLQRIQLPLARFTLQVDVAVQGRVTALFGPSGSGKTSLLDLVAGLRRAPTAFIQLGDRVLTDTASGLFMPARHRGLGYVPQDATLFPHMSVRENLLYGHRRERIHNPLFRYEHVLEVLEIATLQARRVPQLSGGEKQRVALARALLANPRLLLLDEPLASLDIKLKARILPYLTRVREEFGLPMLYVTHDRTEALAMADEIIVLNEGRVLQAGPVRDVFNRPANLEVASLLQVETVQPGRVVEAGGDLVKVDVAGTVICALGTALPLDVRDVFVCIRAEDIILARGGDVSSSARNHLPATVRAMAEEAAMMRVDLDAGFPLTAVLTRQACAELGLVPGSPVTALVKAPHVHLIPHRPPSARNG